MAEPYDGGVTTGRPYEPHRPDAGLPAARRPDPGGGAPGEYESASGVPAPRPYPEPATRAYEPASAARSYDEAPPAYEPTGAGPVPWPHSAPGAPAAPNAQTAPWSAPAPRESVSGPGFGAAPAPFTAPPRAAARPRRDVLTLALIGVLLVVVVAQSALLFALYSRTGDLGDRQRADSATIAGQRQDLSDLGKRVAGLEERTKGTLNSTAIARKVLPSVFRIKMGATGTAFALAKVPGGGTLLVTNYHVVQDAVEAGQKTGMIERASESYPVTVERLFPDRDIAVLRSTQNFPTLAAVKKDVEPGEPVIVVGAPLGLTDTVTTGVVSAVRDGIGDLKGKVIQFDAAISPGNSGGPVINAEGLVAGVAQAKITEDNADGLGLAIPISQVCDGPVAC